MSWNLSARSVSPSLPSPLSPLLPRSPSASVTQPLNAVAGQSADGVHGTSWRQRGWRTMTGGDPPPIPPKTVNEDGRTANDEDAQRARVWNSRLPSAAWFVSAYDIYDDFEAVGDDEQRTHLARLRLKGILAGITQRMPDISFALVALCRQEVLHYHAVVATCNQYSRAVAEDVMQQSIRAGSVAVTPLYSSVEQAVRYIRAQAVSESTVITAGFVPEAEIWRMGSYGNIWAREFTGDNTRGFDRLSLSDWCSCGYPQYAVDATPRQSSYATRAARDLNEAMQLGRVPQRGYHNALHVVVRHEQAGRRREPVVECRRALESLFGKCAAARPFVYDITGILTEFLHDPLPGYRGQPGIVLVASKDYEQSCGSPMLCAQRRTVANIEQRAGVFANVEYLYIVKV